MKPSEWLQVIIWLLQFRHLWFALLSTLLLKAFVPSDWPLIKTMTQNLSCLPLADMCFYFLLCYAIGFLIPSFRKTLKRRRRAKRLKAAKATGK